MFPRWAITKLSRCNLASFRHRRGSTLETALCVLEAPSMDPQWFLADCCELDELLRSRNSWLTSINYPEDISAINGVPSWQRCRRVQIRRSQKFANRIGTHHTHHWQVEWEPQKTWENSLMGWTSTADPYCTVEPICFPNEESAVLFCERNGYEWYMQRESQKFPNVRRYEDNFHWCRRCRVSTR